MRSIETKIDIPESRKDDFRREIMNYIGALAVEGKSFAYDTNERLHRALEQKLLKIKRIRSSSQVWLAMRLIRYPAKDRSRKGTYDS